MSKKNCSGSDKTLVVSLKTQKILLREFALYNNLRQRGDIFPRKSRFGKNSLTIFSHNRLFHIGMIGSGLSLPKFTTSILRIIEI